MRGSWLVSDFTLAELTDPARSAALADRDPSYNGKFLIPTFEEVLDLASERRRQGGSRRGVYPETKHPTFHAAQGCCWTPPTDHSGQVRLHDQARPRSSCSPLKSPTSSTCAPKRRCAWCNWWTRNDVHLDGSMDLTAPTTSRMTFAVAGDAAHLRQPAHACRFEGSQDCSRRHRPLKPYPIPS